MKRMLKIIGFAGIVALGLPLASQALASAQTDALSACLVSKTSAPDRLVLIRWIFGAIGRHPDVADMIALPPEKYEAISKQGGELFNRLLTVDCATETRAAIKADGMSAVETSFGALGEVAMEGLMSHPNVEAALGDMTKYVDEDALVRMLVGGK